MQQQTTTEYWLQGPVEGIDPLLQPAAHAILQARKEVQEALQNFPGHLLQSQPAGVASVAFHLQHIAGVLDRLFTYAKGEQLSEQQLAYLQNEGKDDTITLNQLLDQFNKQVDAAIAQLKDTKETILTAPREVGRKKIPSTVIGLLFHAAEHTQRHTGQLLVTAKVLVANNKL